MKREEEILKAARNYVSGVTLSSPSNVIHFENGAKWADKHPNLESLWHETTTQPKLNEWFIAQIGDDAFDTFIMSMTNNKDWKKWSNGINMKMWAYISDLLPKQFRNSKSDK